MTDHISKVKGSVQAKRLPAIILFLLLCTTLHFSCRQDKVDTKSRVENPYQELYRPQFHFSPEEHWMNDPNGLVYFEGEYHLFYQYYPDSTVWGPMHWGHAVSEDLINWTHLPIALYPDSLGYIFSGSAVVDWNNTSGFGTEGQTPLVAIFTHHDTTGTAAGGDPVETQSIAYSLDKGRSWTKYADNPVIDNPGIKDFRDPNVIWYEPEEKWVLVLAAQDRLMIYGSPDLKEWTYLSEFGANEGNHAGVWECPDLFAIQLDGEGDEKWVLIQNINPGHPNGGSGTQYFIGNFDGTTFVNDNPPETELWLDYGKDNYAGVTWFDAPNDQRVFIGWMSNWQYAQAVPTQSWRSAMTLPRTLHLVSTEVGPRMISLPWSGVRRLREEAVAISRADLNGQFELLSSLAHRNGLYEIQLEFIKPDSGRVELEMFNSMGDLLYIGYDVDQNEYYVDRITAGESSFSDDFAGRHIAPCYYDQETVKMHMFVDHASLELFADDGKIAMTEIFFPEEPITDILINVDVAPLRVLRGRVFQLNSIWSGQ